MNERPERKRAESFELPPAVLRRRVASARIRRRRLLLVDVGIALAIVLIALIGGVGVGLLGVIALIALAALGFARICGAALRARTRRRVKERAPSHR